MSKIKIIQITLAIIVAVVKTVKNLDWIITTSNGIHAAALKWIYPFVCVDPSLIMLSATLLFGAVFICVLIWNVTFDLIMAL